MWQVPVGQPDQSLKAFVPKTSPADNRLRQLSEQGINVDASDRAKGMIDEGMCGEYGGAEPTNKEQALMQLEAMGRLPLSDEAAPALEEEGAEQALEAEAAPATLPSLDPEASAWEANGWPRHSQMDAQQVYACAADLCAADVCATVVRTADVCAAVVRPGSCPRASAIA